MEILKVQLFFMNNNKKSKPKERWNARPNFPKKFHGDGRTDGRTENSQKISLFQIFLKIECSRVPIHFKVAAAGAAHPLRDKETESRMIYYLQNIGVVMWDLSLVRTR